jgi:hypothetical protein
MIITASDYRSIVANKKQGNFFIRVDFGTKKVSVAIKNNYACLNGKQKISLTEKIKDNFCYLIKDNQLIPLAFFSPETNLFYKLLPTSDWPTITISSVPMHKVSLMSPKQDSYAKISFINPSGVVLDTCMGLGYTAILAAESAKKVYTFEVDDNVYCLAQWNPFSQALFNNKRISISQKNVADALDSFSKAYFDCIIHDPPTFTLAPNLYTVSFYRRLHYVLKPGGVIFHYTPFYGIKRGIDFPKRVVNKLKQADFLIKKVDPDKGGILACSKD